MCIEIDGNLEALRRHEKQVSDNEVAYESMEDELREAIDLEDILSTFNGIAEKYGFDIKFTEWIGNEI